MFPSLALLFLFVNPLFSNGVTMNYLVWTASLTQVQINAAKGYGYSTNDQPVRITEYVTAPNTNYARIRISTTTGPENTSIQTLLTQGKIQPLQKINLLGAYDGRTGGNVSWTEMEDCKSAPEKYVCLPQDWNRDWTVVAVSSP